MKKLVWLLPLLFGSCSQELPVEEPRPVIEAWIDNDGHPTVLFTTTVSPDPDGGSIESALVRWGSVTISDGKNEYIMTGIRDSRYMPPYKYTTIDLIGESGRSYKIVATFKDMCAEATSTIPAVTAIDSIDFQDCGIDSLRATTLYFTAPDDVPAYYYLSIASQAEPTVAKPCLMGWKECLTPGGKVGIALFNSKRFGENFQPQLRVGERYVVYLHRVEQPVYEFWRAFDNAMLFSGNVLFGSDSSLPSNIIGGYGVFSARATTSKLFTVK